MQNRYTIFHGDVLTVAPRLPTVDLVFCSPPYEAARTYGICFKLRGQDWVDWAVARYMACLSICRGPVCWVVEGQTRGFRWSAVPALFMAELHRRGVHLRKPPAFCRVGIPGSGGPDWLRNDWEFIVCGTRGGKLPWSDNTAMGHPPKWGPGGEMSNRHADGRRINAQLSKARISQWGKNGTPRGMGNKKRDGTKDSAIRPSIGGPGWGMPVDADLDDRVFGNNNGTGGSRPNGDKKPRYFNGKGHAGSLMRVTRGTGETGEQLPNRTVPFPVKANPGNLIKAIVGGGVMGSKLAHENEAPFPEKLAEFFIRSFCPPGGIVLDPFSGSGTTAAVALKHGRRAIAIDVRKSQCELTLRRIKELDDLAVKVAGEQRRTAP